MSSANHFLPPLPNESSGLGRVFNVNSPPNDDELLPKPEDKLVKQRVNSYQCLHQNVNPPPPLNLELLSTMNYEQRNERQSEPLLQNREYLEKAIREFNVLETTQLTKEETWPIAFDDASAERSNQLPQLPQSYEQIQNDLQNQMSLMVRVITWNQQAKETPSTEDLIAHLLPLKIFHVIAISTQECENSFVQSFLNPVKTRWEMTVAETLGPDYDMIRSHALQASHIAVYVHRAIIHLVSKVESCAIPTGICETLGNKGGIGISMKIGESSFCFLNAHLAAHQSELDRRTYEFKKISTEIAQQLGHVSGNDETEPYNSSEAYGFYTSSRKGSKYTPRCCKPGNSFSDDINPLLNTFDHVFWAGDFNFRINGTKEIIEGLLNKDKHSVLLSNEQLKMLMQFDPFFTGFSEGPLSFRPTYKYDDGTDVYDTSSKRRIPAWTDRVLFKSDKEVNLISYYCAQQVRSSDHRPVYASFQLKIDTGVRIIGDGNNISEPTWHSESKSEICVIS